MNIEILTKTQTKEFINRELEKIRKDLYKEMDKLREKILKLEEETKVLRRLR